MIQPVLSFQAVCSISSIMKQGYTFGHSQNEMTRLSGHKLLSTPTGVFCYAVRLTTI